MLDRLYRACGARFANAMIHDNRKNPATQPTVDQWLAAYRLNFDIVLDDEPQDVAVERQRGPALQLRDQPAGHEGLSDHPGLNPDATTIPALSSVLTKSGAPPLPTDAGITTTPDAAGD